MEEVDSQQPGCLVAQEGTPVGVLLAGRRADLPTAVALIAADVCERILDQSIPAEVGTHRLYVVGHEGSPLDDLLPAVAALAARLEDDLGGQADDDLRARLAALARTILNRQVAKNPA